MLVSYALTRHAAAQRYILCKYNIERSKLDAAKRITPGKRAPTVTALDGTSWVAVEAMVEVEKAGDIMDELFAAGADDILTWSIDNSRTSA